MATIFLDHQTFECQWASDVSFDGIRLEVDDPSGEFLFDISVPETGRPSLNTFGKQVPVALIEAAIELVRARQLAPPRPPA